MSFFKVLHNLNKLTITLSNSQRGYQLGKVLMMISQSLHYLIPTIRILIDRILRVQPKVNFGIGVRSSSFLLDFLCLTNSFESFDVLIFQFSMISERDITDKVHRLILEPAQNKYLLRNHQS